MISHSRSSSEGDEVKYTDILFVCIQMFLKDFSFADVKHSVKELFTKDDYESILQETDEQKQIFRLFWILCANEDLVKNFLAKIKADYKWLEAAVQQERNHPSVDAKKYLEAVRSFRISRHKHLDYNVHRVEPFMELRQALLEVKRGKYVVLCGELGGGKKWLAYDVCSEFSVMKAMDFKVFFLNVSHCVRPEDDLGMLKNFQLLLEDYPCHVQTSPSPTLTLTAASASSSLTQRSLLDVMERIPNRIFRIQEEIKRKLLTSSYKKSLLVLMDVPNKKAWNAFNLGCKMLITTRNTKLRQTLSPTLCRYIDLKPELTTAEFYKLFENYTKIQRIKFPENCIVLYDSSKKHPYLLSMIAENIQMNRKWYEWIGNLQNSMSTVNKFNRIIEISLKVLPEGYKDYYTIFAIFQHSIPIPIKLLANLWNTTIHEAESIVQIFANHSMLTKTVPDDGATTCELPFIYSLFFESKKLDTEDLHRKVINYYDLNQTLCRRADWRDLGSNQLDWYFFYSIGYHLREAKRKELFSQLFLNFGFLEQKIRAIGLLDTIGHLKDYENEIANMDNRRRQLLRAITDFLPKIEDKLDYSKDTCLLQYALMESDCIRDEAWSQVQHFPNNVWLADNGNFHHRRQIFKLSSQAHKVIFLEQDLVLIVLHNNNVILADISLDYNKDPILISDLGTESKIVDVRLFHDNNFILTLNDYGELNLWSIQEERHLSMLRRRNSKQKVHAPNFRKYTKTQGVGCRQHIHQLTFPKSKIVAFDVEISVYARTSRTSLHVAFANGDVLLLDWNATHQQFQKSYVPILHTRYSGIRMLSKICNKYYMALTEAGEIGFWCLQDSSKLSSDFAWPSESAVSHQVCTVDEPPFNQTYTYIVFVYRKQILRLTIENKSLVKLDVHPELLYTLTDSSNWITCARVTPDCQYIVLGTKHGLIVFDTHTKSEILRGNVSEDISCVDIYSLKPDPVFKYIIICGTERKGVLYINALRHTEQNSIAWAHDVTQSLTDERTDEPQLEPNVRLCGHKKYDIAYNDTSGCLLLAADSKNRIHQISLTAPKSWAIIVPTESAEPITVISLHGHNAFVGFDNGDIFDIRNEVYTPHFLSSSVKMLQLVDDDYLVASTPHGPETRILKTTENFQWFLKFNCQYCFKVFDHYLLLIDETGRVLILNLNSRNENEVQYDDNGLSVTLGGCDYKNGILFVAMTTHEVHIYKFTNIHDKLAYIKLSLSTEKVLRDNESLVCCARAKVGKEGDQLARVSCLVAADDGRLVAIGLASGCIKLCKLSDTHVLEDIFYMHSHEGEINDLKFSPDARVLISCADQMCFWNVEYMLNNTLKRDNTKRRSSRFASQRSSDVEEIDSTTVGKNVRLNSSFLQVGFAARKTDHRLAGGIDFTQLPDEQNANEPPACNLWQYKEGLHWKPELYSCIKFDGNRAEKIYTNPQFTQFNTIDDEGVYYNFSLLDIPHTNDHDNHNHNGGDGDDLDSNGNGNGNGNGNRIGKNDYANYSSSDDTFIT